MYRSLLTLCGLLTTSLPVCTSFPSADKPQNVDSAPIKLRPISVGDYEAAIGLHRRDEEDFSDLDLKEQSEFIYGSPGENGQLLLANMTLYAPDGMLILAMERFERLTSSVDCDGDDGMMSLTFESENAFNYALKTWDFINQEEEGKFLLIANHAGCGPDDQRQPYLISKISPKPSTLTTLLTAQTASWSDVAGTYDLDFGQALPNPQASKSKRGFWGDIADVGKGALDAAQGNADISQSVNFPMSVGQAGQVTNIYTDADGRLKLDCTNCYVTGSFGVTGHLTVEHFRLQDLTLTCAPSNVAAELQLSATITSSQKIEKVSYTKELFSFPVPNAGIEVDGIFKLGAILSYNIGVSSSFSGTATIDFGIAATLPNTARVLADVQNPDQSSATGWARGALTPSFEIKKESASLSLSAFSQPKLSFGIELIKVGNVEVAVTVKLPEVTVDLSAAYDDAGVCTQTPGSSKTGVKLESKAEVAVNLGVNVKFGADEQKESQFKPSWEKKLWGAERPLGGQCFPLAIPGLKEKVEASGSASVPILSSWSSRPVLGPPVPSVSSTPVVLGPPVPSVTSRPVLGPPVPTVTSTPVVLGPPVPSVTSRPVLGPPVPSASSTTSAAAGGGGVGGGCRMVKRFGKRMLVC